MYFEERNSELSGVQFMLATTDMNWDAEQHISVSSVTSDSVFNFFQV